MAFQIGDRVKFNYEGKLLAGEIAKVDGSTYTIKYNGNFPKTFRTNSKVKIVSGDLALAGGDLAVQDGDLVLTGEALVQCGIDDLQAPD